MAGTAGRSGGNRSINQDRTPANGPPELPQGHSEAFGVKWAALIAELPPSELRRVDGFQLEVLVGQLCEIDELSAMIEKSPEDLKIRSLRLRVAQQVARLSAQFGLSPSDRKRLAFEPEPEPDAFDEWLSGATGGPYRNEN
jgi:hypothetical protein